MAIAPTRLLSLEHRHDDERARTGKVGKCHDGRIAFEIGSLRLYVINVNELFCPNDRTEAAFRVGFEAPIAQGFGEGSGTL